MIDDEELARRLALAHRDDAPPPFVPSARPRRRPFLMLAPIAATACAALLLLARPAPRVELPRLEWHDPLAFLLEPPSADLYRSVPRFETKEGMGQP